MKVFKALHEAARTVLREPEANLSLNKATAFKAGDVVLLRDSTKSTRLILTPPLTDLPESTVPTHSGLIRQVDIIGRYPREVIRSHTGEASYIATLPTLEEWVNLRRRAAQPIYAFDANAVVALADIHIDEREEGHIHEFLEAGTGHGSLTIAIARAIHSANANLPDGAPRKAILHSIDRSHLHMSFGKRNVAEFRRGLYYNDVQFHDETTPAKYLESRVKDGRFLSAAFLDLPELADEAPTIIDRIAVDGKVVVFVPSVTQVIDLIEAMMPISNGLFLERVVELMPGIGGGLRPWDVRFALVRGTDERRWVCRPAVGERVAGGGFVAVFHRRK